jgi:hypothetical protein
MMMSACRSNSRIASRLRLEVHIPSGGTRRHRENESFIVLAFLIAGSLWTAIRSCLRSIAALQMLHTSNPPQIRALHIRTPFKIEHPAVHQPFSHILSERLRNPNTD